MNISIEAKAQFRMMWFSIACLLVYVMAWAHAIPETRPKVIAHRGCSGRYPEMTAISFERAVQERSDLVECDVSVSRDLKLVCSHEAWIESQTNVAELFPEDRKNTYFIQDDGRFINDFFTVDFTYDELKTIGRKQRYSNRDPNFDYLYPMSGFDEHIEIIQNASHPMGLLIEVKDPNWFNSLDIMQQANTSIEDLIIQSLTNYGFAGPESLAIIQSFDLDYIKNLRSITDLPLHFLVNSESEVTDEALNEYAQYGQGIGGTKSLFVKTNIYDQVIERTDLVDRAHAAGLVANAYTFRNEDNYLAWDYGQDPWNEMEDFLNMNIDGFITDFPETANAFLDSVYECA